MEEILDHYQNPRNFGRLEDPDITHQEGNPSCGDEIRIDIQVQDDKIVDIRFSGHGCAISQAAASMLTEMVKGKDLDEVKKIGREEMLDELGIEIGPVRMKCAMLALKVVKAGVYGIKDWPGEEPEHEHEQKQVLERGATASDG